MTAGGRYLSGLLVVVAIGMVVVLAVSPDIRREVASGIGVALLVQAPLGWWTVRSVGTERFHSTRGSFVVLAKRNLNTGIEKSPERRQHRDQ